MKKFTEQQIEILNNVAVTHSNLKLNYHQGTLNKFTDDLNYLDEIGYIYWNNFEENYYLTQAGKDYVRNVVSA